MQSVWTASGFLFFNLKTSLLLTASFLFVPVWINQICKIPDYLGNDRPNNVSDYININKYQIQRRFELITIYLHAFSYRK